MPLLVVIYHLLIQCNICLFILFSVSSQCNINSTREVFFLTLFSLYPQNLEEWQPLTVVEGINCFARGSIWFESTNICWQCGMMEMGNNSKITAQ